MLKSWLITFMIMGIFFIIAAFDLFKYLSSSYTYFIAITMLVSALIAAFVILGIPFVKDDKNGEN